MCPCFRPADILLPDFHTVSPKKWAVIACDQFTSEPDYWRHAASRVGDAPSTLHMILPEVYLEETEARLPRIHSAMKKYEKELLVCHPDSMIYTRRTQSDGSIRHGIVLAIDLSCYDYQKGASSLIRATEATVVERIPPRVAIRREAPLELPHVMLLIDDPHGTVIEPIGAIDKKADAYDTDLMLGGGHISGSFLDEEEIQQVSSALEALITPQAMTARYRKDGLAPLLFAVGDGNHSLASAKATYEELRARIGDEAAASHPARYALAEVVNIHDPALKFEPIYRVLFHVDPKDVLRALSAYIATLHGQSAEQGVEYIYGSTYGSIHIPHPTRQLTVGTLQDFIDIYLADHPEAQVDYIHGEQSVQALAEQPHAIGFLFSGMEKNELFPTVMFDGALPRKTFSMGHAQDKRYYMECRRILPEA